ncbi:ammonium transporter, partial [Sulfurimonas sp. C5]|nr:ammonium transporter [Sulfurimonas sp. C5]
MKRWLVAMLFALPTLALAEDAPKLDTGDTAWMMVSAALVLLMTPAGLALFYAGMTRSKNVLNTYA